MVLVVDTGLPRLSNAIETSKAQRKISFVQRKISTIGGSSRGKIQIVTSDSDCVTDDNPAQHSTSRAGNERFLRTIQGASGEPLGGARGPQMKPANISHGFSCYSKDDWPPSHQEPGNLSRTAGHNAGACLLVKNLLPGTVGTWALPTGLSAGVLPGFCVTMLYNEF